MCRAPLAYTYIYIHTYTCVCVCVYAHVDMQYVGFLRTIGKCIHLVSRLGSFGQSWVRGGFQKVVITRTGTSANRGLYGCMEPWKP